MKKIYLIIMAISIVSIAFSQNFQKNPKPYLLEKRLENSTKAYVQTLSWCTDVLYTGVGTNSATTLTGAAEFDATDLSAYVGNYITQVQVGILNPSVITSAKVLIIENPNTASESVAYEQVVTFNEGWNSVFLNTPYQIGSTPIFVAYQIVVTGGHPMGFDQGPTNVKGNWLKTGTGAWQHAPSSLPYNNSIKAFVHDATTDPVLTAFSNINTLNSIIGESPASGNFSVFANNLTNNTISVTTALPFEVSTDGTTYSTTLNLTATEGAYSGSLYVRYNPATTQTTETGTITISSTGVDNVVLSVNGKSWDCSVTYPLAQGFENDDDPGIICWTAAQGSSSPSNSFGVSNDADDARTGDYFWLFGSYNENEDDNYNQYLITPELPVTTGGFNVSFYYAGYGPAGTSETFRIGHSSTTTDISAFTWLAEQTATNSTTVSYSEYTATVPAGTKYIAINYTSDYSYYLFIDDITIDEATTTDAPIATVTPMTWAAGNVTINQSSTSGTFTLKNTGTGTLTVSNITDLSGTAWSSNFGSASSISLTANAEHTFTFTFAPTALGASNQNFVITTNAADGVKTISLSGTGVDDVSVPTEIVNDVNIYPNPSNGAVNINVEKASEITIVDVTGKVINTYKANSNSSITFTNTAGIYFVNVKSEGKTDTYKLIISN